MRLAEKMTEKLSNSDLGFSELVNLTSKETGMRRSCVYEALDTAFSIMDDYD